jgi:small subunit ribosomal protein S8
MSVTDPIADMLNRIRNACAAQQAAAVMAHSNMKGEIAGLLKQQGYVREVVVDGEGPAKKLRIVLKYNSDRKPTIRGLRRISKPGLRRYVGTDEIPRVLGGMGVAILSTPGGIMTDQEARHRHVGGEVLVYVW